MVIVWLFLCFIELKMLFFNTNFLIIKLKTNKKMKNFTLLAVVFMLLSFSVQAQTNLMVGADANPDFEGYDAGSDNIYWWFRQVNSGAAALTAVTTSPQSGSRCFEANVTTKPTNPYDIQVISVRDGTSGGNGYYSVAAMATYTLRFWAKADANGKQINALMQNSGFGTPDNTIAGTFYGVTLTNTWAQYVVTFSNNSSNAFRPVFQFGYDVGTYSVDNVEFFEGAPLPVDLLSFQANASKNKTVGLNWQVADEKRIKAYSIERSAEGQKFSAIGSVAAQNSSTQTSYAFNDENPLKGINYYRLKINEEDGTFKYSKVQSIRTGASSKALIYPNPTSDYIQVKNTEGVESVEIFDISGRSVRQFLNNASSQLDISSLPKGVYQVAIKANGETNFSRVVKM
jgi:Secretion system C-terminal sorting domain/Carbohydrate binding domain